MSEQESIWAGREVEVLTLQDVRDVIDGTVACVIIRGFLDPDASARVVERFDVATPGTGAYGVVPTRQVGMPLMPVDLDNYFAASERLNAEVDAVFGDVPNQALRVRAEMERATGWRTVTVDHEGAPYLRSLFVSFPPGAHIPVHVDRSSDIEGLILIRFPIQLSWNIYLQPSEGGGELWIYDRAFVRNEVTWVGDGHGGLEVDDGLLRKVAKFSFETGDLILFDANRYHEVTAITGDRSRVFAHGFISVDSSAGEMAYWT